MCNTGDWSRIYIQQTLMITKILNTTIGVGIRKVMRWLFVKYIGMIPLLIEALIEQQNKIERLRKVHLK